MSDIPSDEDFLRAKRKARERSKNLDTVNEFVNKKFRDSSPLHYFTILPQRENEFWAVIFFKNESDISKCEKNGVTSGIKSYVYDELSRRGKGEASDIRIIFEIDSDENVAFRYGGDYSLRLR